MGNRILPESSLSKTRFLQIFTQIAEKLIKKFFLEQITNYTLKRRKDIYRLINRQKVSFLSKVLSLQRMQVLQTNNLQKEKVIYTIIMGWNREIFLSKADNYLDTNLKMKGNKKGAKMMRQ